MKIRCLAGWCGAVGTSLVFLSTASSALLEPHVLPGHVPAGLTSLKPAGRLPGTNRLDLAIELPLRNKQALTELLQEIYDPASPNYRRYLTPEQFTERFGPTQQQYDEVIAFAQNHGLKVTGTHANRVLVDVAGTVADVDKAFGVTLRLYAHPKEPRMFFAPDTEPSVDAALPVLAIVGLNNYLVPRPMNLRASPSHLLTTNEMAATGSGPGGNFIGSDFRAAYVPGVTLTGTGQIVGLLECDGYNTNDINLYATMAGLPKMALTNVLVDGASGLPSGSGGEVEVSLDIEMAMSMAPGLTKVMVYEAPSDTPAYIYDLLNRMATDNQAKQLSSSWVIRDNTNQDQLYLEFAAQGQSFFQASGDEGSYYPGVFQWQDDLYVTLVGGTTLTTTGPGGAWSSETVWNWGGGTAGGGGISTNNLIPTWQQGISMSANGGSTVYRNIPDVALTADNVYVIADNGVGYPKTGGTSCAAPLWAAFMALVNQQAATQSQPPAGFINPTVYFLGKGLHYASDFHDITTGNNTNSSNPSRFYAVAGYDLCTGWGTPAGQNLINALSMPPDTLQITPATGFAAHGGAGGPFDITSGTLLLTNAGTNFLNWTLANTSLWLNASPANGTLSPTAPTANVLVSLNTAVSNLTVGTYSATVSFTNLSDGVVQVRQFSVAVLSPPVITQTPSNQTVLGGATATFSVGATGGPPLQYAWQFNGTNLTDGGQIFGSATNILTVSNVSVLNTGAYSVIVSNPAGVATSAPPAILTLTPSPPVFAQQPASQTVNLASTAQFNALALGDPPMGYQWQFNAVNITNATNATLVLSSVTTNLGGNYAVIASNGRGSTASTNAVLTVVTNVPSLITFDDLPGGNAGVTNGYGGLNWSNILCVNGVIDTNTGYSAGVISLSNIVYNAYGSNAMISATGSFNLVSAYLTAAWNDNLQLTARGYAGATLLYSNTYTLSATAPRLINFGYSGVNQVLFNSFGGSQHPGYGGSGTQFVMDNATVTAAPVLTTQPASTIVLVGGNVVFSVAATGTAPLSYSWNRNGVPIPGATAASYSLFNAQLSDSGSQFGCSVSNLFGAALSSNAVLTVTTNLGIQSVYMRSVVGPPWGMTNNETAMNRVFGAGTWQDLRYETVNPATLFTSANRFIFMEGSDIDANGLTTFLASNNVAIQNWVMNGGRLFLNAAPNTGASINFGFGVTLAYNGADFTDAAEGVNPAHPIFNGPFTPVGTNWTGNHFAHATLSGLSFTPLIINSTNARAVLGEASPGLGHALFGGMALDAFQSPQPQAANLRANIIAYLSALGTGTSSINTTNAWNGTDNLYPLGEPSIATYGQTFVAPPSSVLNSFTLYLSNSTGTVNFELYVMAWDGSEATGPILYQSAPTNTAGAAGWHPYTFNVGNLPLTGGSNYVAFVSESTLFDGVPDAAAIGSPLSDVYTNGFAVFADNGTNFNSLTNTAWSTAGARDLAFVAVFGNPPNIVSQSGDQTVGIGDTVTFTVSATGQPPLSYTWTQNGSPITGATTTSYTLSNAQLTNSGTEFNCLVSNAFGTATTTNALLTVTSSPPAIIAQSGSVTVGIGDTTTFTVVVSGSPPLSYAWIRNGSPITGATTTSYMLTNAQLTDSGSQFSCLVSNAFGTAASTNALLTVTSSPPAIIAQSGNVTAVVSGTATFTVSASGSPPLSYAWIRNGSPIAGASATSYTLFSAQLTDSGSQFSCLVSNAFGTAATTNALLTVTGVPPAIVAQSSNVTIGVGGSASFSVTASGTVPLSYIWRRNGGVIVGASGFSYTLTNAQTTDSGAQFSCLVTNLSGSVTSSPAVLTVTNVPSTTVLSQGNLVITLDNNAGRIHSFQYRGAEIYRVGTYVSDWGLQTGTNSATFVRNEANTGTTGQPMLLAASNSVSAAYTGNYVSGAANVSITRTYALQPGADLLSIVQTFTNNAVSSITLRCFDTYDPDWSMGGVMSYAMQAHRYTLATNGFSIQMGRGILTNNGTVVLLGTSDTNAVLAASFTAFFGITTSANLNTLFSSGGADSGGAVVDDTLDIGHQFVLPPGVGVSFVFYQSLATNVSQAESAIVNVAAPPVPPAISSQPTNQTVIMGASATFRVGATGGAPLAYQWLRNGGSISGATASAYTLTNAQPGDSGGFSCMVTNRSGSATSQVALLTVLLPNTYYTTNGIVINDNAIATPYPSTLTVNGATGMVGRLMVSLYGVTHTWPHDVGILLVGPQGQNVVLMADCGAGQPILNENLTFDDDASAVLGENSPIASGTYRPTSAGTGDTFPPPAPLGPYGTGLYAFRGTSLNGVWSLYVLDDDPGDSGMISYGWGLTLTNDVPLQITQQPQSQILVGGNIASFSIGAIGANPFTYQWQSNGANLVEGGRISGSLTPYLTITNVQTSDAGSYSVLVSDAVSGPISSAAAALAVYPPGQPVILPDSFHHFKNGQFQFTLAGATGSNYEIQVSSDLTNWKSLNTLVLTNSSETFLDVDTNVVRRFYRAMLLP